MTLWDAATDWKPRTFRRPPGTFGMRSRPLPGRRRLRHGERAVGKRDVKAFVTIWDAATGEQLRRGPEDHGTKVSVGGLAFSPDGKKLLWGDQDTDDQALGSRDRRGPDVQGAQGGVFAVWRSIPGAAGSPRRAATGR